MRVHSIIPVLIGPMLLWAAGCSKEAEPAAGQQAPAPPPTPVVVATIGQADVPVVREYVARTEAITTVMIEARVEALLQTMEFEEGRRVTEGQVLYRLDTRTYDANLASTKAGLAKANADLKLAQEQVSVRAAEAGVARTKAALNKAKQDVARLEPLAAQDAVPQQDLDTAIAAQEVAQADLDASEAELENSRIREEVGVLQAQAQLQAAEAAVSLAELDLGYCTITSPLDGLIGRTQVNIGNLVGRGGTSELVEVSSIDPIYATLSVSEAEYLRSQKAQEEGAVQSVQIILADDSIYPHEGEIMTADRAVALETGTLQVVVSFPNPDGELRPGQFGRVRAVVGLLEDAVLVPQRSIMEQQGAKIVLVVGDGDKVALRTVHVSERFEDSFVVTDGLEVGDRVVLEGQLKVRPGMTVDPKDKPISEEPGEADDETGDETGTDAAEGN